MTLMRLGALIRRRTPHRVVKSTQSISHQGESSEWFVKKMDDVDKGLVNSALHFKVVVLESGLR